LLPRLRCFCWWGCSSWALCRCGWSCRWRSRFWGRPFGAASYRRLQALEDYPLSRIISAPQGYV